MSVHEVVTHHAEAVRLAGALEASSEHPVGRAVAEYAARTGPQPVAVAAPRVDRLRQPRGHRRLRRRRRPAGPGRPGAVRRGAARARRRRGHPLRGLPYALAQAVVSAREAGRTAVLVEVDDRPVAVFDVGDTVKATSADAVRRLRGLGLHPVLLTGDHATRARGGRRRGRHRRGGRRGAARPTRRRPSRRCGGRAAWWRWSATASTTRPRWSQADLGVAMGTGTAVADRGRRRHPHPRRPARGRGRDRAVPAHPAHDRAEPVLGVRLQRRGDPGGGAGAARTR